MTENNIENIEELPVASRLVEKTEHSVIAEEAPVVEETVVIEETKAEEPKGEVITTPNAISKTDEEPANTEIGNSIPSGAFSTEAPKKTAKKSAAKTDKKVDATQIVIFADKNLYFPGTGKITFGFNIVSEKDAKVYLKHKSVREATPEELARKYAK